MKWSAVCSLVASSTAAARAWAVAQSRTGTLLLLLEAGERHLGARDVLLRVLQVLEEGLLSPDDALLLVGGGVGVAGGSAALAAEEAVQRRAGLVAAVLHAQARRAESPRHAVVSPPSRWKKCGAVRSFQRTASTVWHWRQRVLNSFAPFSTSPAGIPMVGFFGRSCARGRGGVDVDRKFGKREK